MTEGRPARIVGKDGHIYASCWHCPASLGEILSPDRNVEGVWAIAVPEYYRPAPIPVAWATAGIQSVLVIAPRAKANLARTGLPWRRRRAMDKDGGVRVSPSRQFALPTVMPCRRPGCGEANLVVDKAITDG